MIMGMGMLTYGKRATLKEVWGFLKKNDFFYGCDAGRPDPHLTRCPVIPSKTLFLPAL
jgi:hypothetical protein